MSAEQFSTENNPLLWQPSQDKIDESCLTDFINHLAQKNDCTFRDYHDFWQWSVNNLEAFWSAVWDKTGIIGDKGEEILTNPEQMQKALFFPEASLNYAENLLCRNDERGAIIFRNEKGQERVLSWRELNDQVSRLQQFLKDSGIQKGDRVAGYLPNLPETIVAHLATASLGAIWSSASPDFGVEGILDRFGQIEPKVLIAADGYLYNGKTFDCLEKVKDVQARLPSLQQTIIVSFTTEQPDISELSNASLYSNLQKNYEAAPVEYERVGFNYPLVIMFSSGTTGKPKCIVHGHGGTLIQHLKEHQLQCNIKPEDNIFYFTTCGWMMWNWLVTALASQATLMLYDGFPFYPDGNVLWDYAEDHGAKLFGTAAKYIDALKVNHLEPKQTHNLANLEVLTSTGSPLVHESFDYVYDSVKSDLHLASISGGTDIISCFVLGNPITPVYRGEIQGAGLGMAVDVFNEEGLPIAAGAGSGELVCTRPFPCMPVFFWGDEDGQRYYDAYFSRFENIWCHGDWIERTAHNGFIIHGRSDATLNPGGVRIGTAEIYRQVEQIPEVVESIAVGQDWEGDVRVVLFVILRQDQNLTEDLQKNIKSRIRSGASPRHVPAKILQVEDIPRTKSGKITELAVRDVIHHRSIKNMTALANPEALEAFKDLPELARD